MKTKKRDVKFIKMRNFQLLFKFDFLHKKK